MTDSNRVPGYPMRYVAAKKLDDDLKENIHQYDVHGDGSTGIEPRTAKPEDARHVPSTKDNPFT